MRLCAKGKQICFKVKLQQEGSLDFKQCFKVKDLFQMLLPRRSYCDGNDMLRGKSWFLLDRGRTNFAMIEVPYEGQTTKSLIHSLSNSTELAYLVLNFTFFCMCASRSCCGMNVTNQRNISLGAIASI